MEALLIAALIVGLELGAGRFGVASSDGYDWADPDLAQRTR